MFFPYTDSTVAEFTTPPRKAGKKRKSIDSAHAHDHSLLPTEGASVATPSPTTTKKRTIRRDSSGLTSPSTPPTPSILNTPTNPHKPRKPMSARARYLSGQIVFLFYLFYLFYIILIMIYKRTTQSNYELSRKIEAKQQLAIDEGSYMRMMEVCSFRNLFCSMCDPF